MSGRSPFAHLANAAPAILPSLLLCDFGNLEREVDRLTAAGVPALHLDVMDGVFVPNFTYGMTIVSAFRKLTPLPLDVHLMMVHPERYLDQFRAAGADGITIHVEAVEDPRPALEQIRSLGAAAGLALNPGTPLSRIEPALDLCDLVLVMSVDAGFGGQKFNPMALEKLAALRRRLPPGVCLEVDGGINSTTIAAAAQAGAELFVVGSAIFGQSDYPKAVGDLVARAALPVKR